MEYSKLNLAQASIVKKEVDLTLQKLNELIQTNPANNNPDVGDHTIQVLNYQNYKQKILNSIQNRIDELEQFYLQNSDDERAVLFEKERLKLRKILQNFYNNNPNLSSAAASITPRDTNSLSNTKGVNDSRSIVSGVTGNKSALNQSTTSAVNNNTSNNNNVAMNNPNVSELNESNQNGPRNLSNTSMNNTSMNKSGSFRENNNNSQMLSSKKSPSNRSYIYAWEERTDKPSRQELIVEDIVYEPSDRAGFYKRKGHLRLREQPPHPHGAGGEEGQELPDELEYELIEEHDDDVDGLDQLNETGSPTRSINRAGQGERFLDFQIILTHDEITALAARRKKERDDNKLIKSQAAATSIHSSTPYVDPRRIKLEMLRPGHPDRWVHPEGMRYKE